MSANVELIRALQPAPDVDLTEFFHRGDDEGAAAQAEALAPVFTDDFVCIFHAISEDPRPGVEGLRDSWLDWLAPWQGYRAEIEDVIEVGDHVLVLSRDFGRRPGDEREVELFGSAVYTMRDGRIARAEYYAQRAHAFAMLGLQQQSA